MTAIPGVQKAKMLTMRSGICKDSSYLHEALVQQIFAKQGRGIPRAGFDVYAIKDGKRSRFIRPSAIYS